MGEVVTLREKTGLLSPNSWQEKRAALPAQILRAIHGVIFLQSPLR